MLAARRSLAALPAFGGLKRSCVYLDCNATTPLAPEVIQEITTSMIEFWGNPSSSHELGLMARECIERARRSVAKMINAASTDIVFYSGGTEANNTVLDSAARYFSEYDGCKPHIIITNMEHDSISLTAAKMREAKRIELTVVQADCFTGKVSPQLIVGAIQPNTVLVSVMLANNETGIIQPVAEIVKAVQRYVEDTGRMEPVFIHSDAAQAIGKIPVDVSQLDVDYLTIVGHKYYGPRIGALYVRGLEKKSVPLYPLLCGGGQEREFRPGTENTAMIAGLGKASDLVIENIDCYYSHMKMVRDYLEEQLQSQFGEKVCFNGRFDDSERIPNTTNISLVGPKLQGHKVLSELKYSQASVGAACHSHEAYMPSQLLLALGIPEHKAINALRLSVGRGISKEDIDVFIFDLKQAIGKLEMS